ncbi:hypothetical protein C5Y96_08020 [Blastopirellula marina]|uniref:DUF1570 domain-containing protein n=1 Tax=Blastopirellula marina TaxID=124 RepID=A0A2S8FY34_9BACT|nr:MULTISPECIES: DUF1570 domain-containing protein [Pirellulaceae]PQO37095.1 hypothetical protein C5Y96_08020 [Blastopirellula marina]RCS53810.1 DUF1570 domain-containing protein [Bremerella cremea]
MKLPRLALLSILSIWLTTCQLLTAEIVGQQATYPVMIQLDLQDETIQATPVLATQQRVIMLGRDGRMWDFAPQNASNFTQLATPFRPLRQNEMRGDLLAEFGNGYDVTGTGNYLVVHPAGQKDAWANQFESLFRSFQQYFAARGIHLQRNEFPLVAVVFPDFKSYQKYAAQDGMRVSPGVVGYYSGETNRVALYDITHGHHDNPLWAENMATIIHEATHQTAFNTGVHSRYAQQPKWLVEGLATMFEAPGVWDSRNNPNFRDRVNKTRMLEFLEYTKTQRAADSLARFVATDDAYYKRPSTAYGEGWAMVFYLIETRPREFAAYVRTVAARSAEDVYTAEDRVRDFQDAFGSDLAQMEAYFLRYISDLPNKM